MSDPIHMTRHDPARNMARFYRIELAPDLFGGVQLVRHWGRVGTDGRSLRHWLATPDQAAAECRDWTRRKQRRGYRPG